MLQATWDRLRPLTNNYLVVTGGAHAAAVARQLPELAAENLLVEPLPRDSAAAIGLAAAVLLQRDPAAILGSFAADHIISQEPVFQAVIRQAARLAETGLVATIGINPSGPATGYGYLRPGSPLGLSTAPDAVGVQQFVEKPSAELAQEYLAAGYRWNAGIFVAQAATIMQLLGDFRPQLAAELWRIAMAWDTPQRTQVLDEVWPGLERVAIDYALAEPAAEAGRVAMVPGDFGWDDLGDFQALSAILPPQPVQTLGGSQVLAIESSGLVVAKSERLVALLGVEDIVVVDTPDALLITHRALAQHVKDIVQQLQEQPELL
jgi:mannose-1-phosphate guanylyltransferase